LRRCTLRLEEAAAVDGASPVRALFRVVIPVAAPGIAAAAVRMGGMRVDIVISPVRGVR